MPIPRRRAPSTRPSSAGTQSTAAGKSSPFILRVARKDGEQEFSSLDVVAPKGFTASLKGVSYCGEAAISAAADKSGAAEQASPSCPASSRIGTLTAAAGTGTNPFYSSGNAYLAGPYKGAPISAVLITPVVAGPFDLGTIVVRAALDIDPETTQVTIHSDPIPQIFDGVPLRIQSIVTRIDRPGFSINPTNCQPKAITATIGGASGAVATPSNAFQVAGCKQLGFAPETGAQAERLDKTPRAPGAEGDRHLPEGRLREHRLGGRRPAERGVPRPVPHRNGLHPRPVRDPRLPGGERLRLRQGDDAAARRPGPGPGLPAQLLQQTARSGRRSERPDRGRPRRQGRHQQSAAESATPSKRSPMSR